MSSRMLTAEQRLAASSAMQGLADSAIQKRASSAQVLAASSAVQAASSIKQGSSSGPQPQAPPKTLQEAKANMDAAQQEITRLTLPLRGIHQEVQSGLKKISDEQMSAVKREEDGLKQKMEESLKRNQEYLLNEENRLRKDMEAAVIKLRQESQEKLAAQQKEITESTAKATKAIRDKGQADVAKLYASGKELNDAMAAAGARFKQATGIYETMLRQQGPPRRGGRAFRKNTRTKKQKRATSRR